MASAASIGETVPARPSVQSASTARFGGSRSFPPGIPPKRSFLKRFMETQASYYSGTTGFSEFNATTVLDDQSSTSGEVHDGVRNSSDQISTADPVGHDVVTVPVVSPARSSTDSGCCDVEKAAAATGKQPNRKRKRRKLISGINMYNNMSPKVCQPAAYRTAEDVLDILLDKIPQQPSPGGHECVLCSPPKDIEKGRVFSCHWQHCQTKPFKKRHHLLDHLNSHNGNKPQRCRFCGRTFTHSGTKSRHERSCASNPDGRHSNRTVTADPETAD